MSEHNLDVIFLTETKSTAYYSYTSEQHLVIQSGNHKDKYAGVGAIIHPKIRPYLADVIQVSNRLIHLTFNKKGGRIHLLGAYAPHSGLDHDSVREPFWDSLQECVDRIPQPEPIFVSLEISMSDSRPPTPMMQESLVLTHMVRVGGFDHNAQSNRSLCVKAMTMLQMVEAGSYKTPNPTHQITYRDKTAPPTDRSQFLLDPLIMQQFYAQVFKKDEVQSLEICTYIRSFLELPQPLPPYQNVPHPDPTRFQRLDHMFIRSQWLSSINSCRPKLHTGFPSDHYLLVTEIQVKLAQRKVKPSYSPKLDFSKVNQNHQG